MKKKLKKEQTCPRLDPEEQLCPRFDSAGIALYSVADPGEMGFRVVSNFPEEHIQ